MTLLLVIRRSVWCLQHDTVCLMQTSKVQQKYYQASSEWTKHPSLWNSRFLALTPCAGVPWLHGQGDLHQA